MKFHRFQTVTFSSLRRLALSALLAAVPFIGHVGTGWATPAASITSADGLLKPTMAFNLSGIAYWGTKMPFLDLMKTSGTFRTDDWDRLEDSYLDTNGWPKAMPPGVNKLISVFRVSGSDTGGSSITPGRYVVSFEGRGSIGVRGGRVFERGDNRLVFEYRDTKTIQIEIADIDPGKTGDYPRNITMIREEHLPLHEAGALFNPEWLAVIADTSQIRFMDWMKTSNSPVSDWSDMVAPDYASWSTKGVPVAVMVTLANQIGADPWFTMPHLATDEYVRRFATYVRDHLDPALQVTVEYSNEAWNNAFQHTQWMHAQAKQLFGTDKAWSPDFYAKRATEVALIWKEVFGAEAETRVVAALGTQTANPAVAARILKAEMWRKVDRRGFVAPEAVFDALAVTTYFGGRLARFDDQRDRLIAAIKDPGTDAARYAYEVLLGDAELDTTANLRDTWADNARLAQEAGLALIAYEGGQHVHHRFAAKIPEQDLEILSAFFTEFVRTEHMAALYEENWEAWKAVSDGPYMQFYEVGAPSRWGSWGLLASLNDSSPRARFAFERNASDTPWWDDTRSGAQALQGRTLFAAVGGEILLGTVQEDFLIGAAGDDTLVGGPGDDGLHGGAGMDVAVLGGAPEDYVITPEGAGWRLQGPDGSDFLIAVETLRFDSGPVIDVAEVAAGQAN